MEGCFAIVIFRIFEHVTKNGTVQNLPRDHRQDPDHGRIRPHGFLITHTAHCVQGIRPFCKRLAVPSSHLMLSPDFSSYRITLSDLCHGALSVNMPVGHDWEIGPLPSSSGDPSAPSPCRKRDACNRSTDVHG